MQALSIKAGFVAKQATAFTRKQGPQALRVVSRSFAYAPIAPPEQRPDIQHFSVKDIKDDITRLEILMLKNQAESNKKLSENHSETISLIKEVQFGLELKIEKQGADLGIKIEKQGKDLGIKIEQQNTKNESFKFRIYSMFGAFATTAIAYVNKGWFTH